MGRPAALPLLSGPGTAGLRAPARDLGAADAGG